MSELKLLNCPFCGGKAKYMEIKDFFVSRFVTCTKCGIETQRNCLNRKDAIKRWNTRTPMANIVENIEKHLEEDSHNEYSSYYRGNYQMISVYDAIDTVKQEINNGLE